MSPSDPRKQSEKSETESAPEGGAESSKAAESSKVAKGRRGARKGAEQGLERIAEVHYCTSDEDANQYLALGPEWDLQDILPMRVETQEGGERDEVHFIVARWETDRDRARLRQRDRRFTMRGKKP